MRVAITGADGFIGKNLRERLAGFEHVEILALNRAVSLEAFRDAITGSDFIFHLAGVNRPENPADFRTDNAMLTKTICDLLLADGRRTPLVLTSSTQASAENPYGQSKRHAENSVLSYIEMGGAGYIYRLPNVFGKWARPNYNSAVATFCHNIARDLPIRIDNPDAPLRLIHVDTVVSDFVRLLDLSIPFGVREVDGDHVTTVGFIAKTVADFAEARCLGSVPQADDALQVELYATFMSALPPDKLVIPLRFIERGGEIAPVGVIERAGEFGLLSCAPGDRHAHYAPRQTRRLFLMSGSGRLTARDIWSDRVESQTNVSAPAALDLIPGLRLELECVDSERLVALSWSDRSCLSDEDKVPV